MSNGLTEEKLQGYLSKKQERDQILDQIERLEAALYYPKPQRLSDMPKGSTVVDAMGNMVAKREALLTHYRGLEAALTEEMLEIEQTIEALSPDARRFMRYRYLMGYKARTICEAMNISLSTLKRLRRAAFKELCIEPATPTR